MFVMNKESEQELKKLKNDLNIAIIVYVASFKEEMFKVGESDWRYFDYMHGNAFKHEFTQPKEICKAFSTISTNPIKDQSCDEFLETCFDILLKFIQKKFMEDINRKMIKGELDEVIITYKNKDNEISKGKDVAKIVSVVSEFNWNYIELYKDIVRYGLVQSQKDKENKK